MRERRGPKEINLGIGIEAWLHYQVCVFLQCDKQLVEARVVFNLWVVE